MKKTLEEVLKELSGVVDSINDCVHLVDPIKEGDLLMASLFNAVKAKDLFHKLIQDRKVRGNG